MSIHSFIKHEMIRFIRCYAKNRHERRLSRKQIASTCPPENIYRWIFTTMLPQQKVCQLLPQLRGKRSSLLEMTIYKSTSPLSIIHVDRAHFPLKFRHLASRFTDFSIFRYHFASLHIFYGLYFVVRRSSEFVIVS